MVEQVLVAGPSGAGGLPLMEEDFDFGEVSTPGGLGSHTKPC